MTKLRAVNRESELHVRMEQVGDEVAVLVNTTGEPEDEWYLVSLRIANGKLVMSRHTSIVDQFIETDEEGRIVEVAEEQ